MRACMSAYVRACVRVLLFGRKGGHPLGTGTRRVIKISILFIYIYIYIYTIYIYIYIYMQCVLLQYMNYYNTKM